MRIQSYFGLTVLWLVVNITGISAISWEEIQVEDPISGHSVTVQQWRSFGGYIYGFPSKYDGVYWPYIDPQWIWFCPENGYTSFGNDFTDLSEDEILRIKEYLSANYDKNQPPTLKEKLQLLEKIYEMRNKDFVFWAWFYRVLAAWHDGAAFGKIEQDPALALDYRKKALPYIELQMKYTPPGFAKIQHLYLVGEYNRQKGNRVEAKIYFARAKKLQWIDENGSVQIGHEYITRIIEEREQPLESWKAYNRQQELILSAGLGDADKVRSLLDAGANVHEVSENGRTAMMWAAWAGHIEVTHLLLDSGSSVDAASAGKSTPLMLATNAGHTEIVQILLNASGKVDAQDENGMTALMFATIQDYEEIARRLIQAGADIDIESKEGGTALGYAITLQRTRMIQLLNQAAAEKQQDADLYKERLYAEITRDVILPTGPHPDVLPEGRSVFYGEYTCAQGLAGSVTIIHRSGGDLTIVNLNGSPLSEKNIQPVGHYRAVGTYNPQSNRYTEVPDAWLSPSTPGWIMAGRNGGYDAETGQLAGTVLIGATWANGSPLCTTFKHSRIAQTEHTDVLGQEPFKRPLTLTGTPMTLPAGASRWTGTFSFHGSRFDLTLELNHDQGGRMTGTFAFRGTDTGSAEAAFLVAGTHNPDTGRFSMGPEGWSTAMPAGEQMYFIDGHHLKHPRRLSIQIVTGSGACTDEEIVVLSPIE